MTAAEITTADRATCESRMELLAELCSDPDLQRVTRDRYRDESDLLLARLEHLDGVRYCASCENAEVEVEGDRCDDCHQRAVELADERATEGL